MCATTLVTRSLLSMLTSPKSPTYLSLFLPASSFSHLFLSLYSPLPPRFILFASLLSETLLVLPGTFFALFF